MNVTIYKDDGTIVADYPIIIKNLDHPPSDEDFYTEAWNCALEDKLVKSGTRDKHSFKLYKSS